MDGFGIYRYKEGDIYEGGFREGKKQGFGRAYFADGDSYVGNYENDKMCGRGVYKSADGDVFDGEYSGDMMNGMGKCTFKNMSCSDRAFFRLFIFLPLRLLFARIYVTQSYTATERYSKDT